MPPTAEPSSVESPVYPESHIRRRLVDEAECFTPVERVQILSLLCRAEAHRVLGNRPRS